MNREYRNLEKNLENLKIRLKKIDSDIQNKNNRIDELQSQIDFEIFCLEDELIDLINEKAETLERISKIENSQEYKRLKEVAEENRVIVLPGQISIHEVLCK